MTIAGRGATGAEKLVFLGAALLSGEVLAFAIPGVAGVRWIALGALALVALAVFGWGRRAWPPALAAGLGFVLAAFAEGRLERALAAGDARADGSAPALEFVVEGDVRVRPRKKSGEEVSFLSHLGPLEVVVHAPRAAGAAVPRVGETWRAVGWLARERKGRSRWSRRDFWVVKDDAGSLARTAEAPAWSPTAFYARTSDALAARAGLGLGWCPELAALNRAILLGRRADLPRERRAEFVSAGTVHVFAISGLHVMLVAGLVMILIRCCGVPFALRGVVAVPLVVAFVVLTGARPSAVRAAVMAAFYLLAPAIGRRSDALAAWALTALGVFALAPERLFDLGALLSFAVMFGIVTWVKWLARHWPEAADPEEDASRCVKLVAFFGVTFAAWVAGVPIAARAFGRFTPGGLVANVFVLPLAAMTVGFGAFGLVASFVATPLAALFNNLAACTTWGMVAASSAVARLPGATFDVEPWSLLHCAGWYGCWTLVLLFGAKAREGLRKWW